MDHPARPLDLIGPFQQTFAFVAGWQFHGLRA